MEMKLDPQHVKTLRLSRSWSQEQLAEHAGLNPRTIQRVETEGSASLNTRLRIARALGVEPGELGVRAAAPATAPAVAAQPVSASDSPSHGWLLDRAYHLPLLLLISLIYLAWTPIYFALSRGNFQSMGPPDWSHHWAPVMLGFWLCVALPWMTFAYRKRRPQIRLHLAYLGALAGFSMLRATQEALAESLLSLALYASGLALLVTCYRNTERRVAVRHMTFIALAAYLFVWLIQKPLSGYMVGGWYAYERGMEIHLPWITFSNFVLRLLGQTTQLFPIALVLLFDLGMPRRKSATPGAPGTSVAHGIEANPLASVQPAGT